MRSTDWWIALRRKRSRFFRAATIPKPGWFRSTLAADLPQSEILTPTPGVALEL